MSQRIKAKVVRVSAETKDTVTIYFVVNSSFNYKAGQYITVYFDDISTKESRVYSLSSCPSDEVASITVKKIGLFSSRLHELKSGDEFDISTPYGFLKVDDDKPIVAIVGGVGVAPVWSILRDTLQRNSDYKVLLLDSNKTHEDVIFYSDIEALKKRCSNFEVEYFVTREKSEDTINRRIDLSLDLPEELKTARIYVCGAVDFVRSMWRQLKAIGVDEANISTESFFGE